MFPGRGALAMIASHAMPTADPDDCIARNARWVTRCVSHQVAQFADEVAKPGCVGLIVPGESPQQRGEAWGIVEGGGSDLHDR